MHVARLVAVLVALAVLTGGCWQTEDDFYQNRTVTYSVSVVGPYDTFTVWYTNSGDARDIREVRPDSPEWRTTVKGEFYEVTGLELRADAYMKEENSSPVPARVSCAIEVDGTVYKRSEKSIHTAACQVDFEDVTTAPAAAPADSAGGGSSSLAPVLWIGAVVAVAGVVAARWSYVRRRRSRGAWPPTRPA